MHRLRLPIAIALCAVLAGCAAHQRSDSLTTTLNAYASTLRWGDFRSALQFVDPDYRTRHPLSSLELARYRQVRVSGYDGGAGPVPAGTDEVRQVVRIELINRNTQRERSIIDRQTWHWDAQAGRWWLTSGLPDITHQP